MPFPLIPVVIGLGAVALAGRKAHDIYGDHPPRDGYCTNCGNTGKHIFKESGVNWKNVGPMGVALGAAGIGVQAATARNVYTCSRCKHLTLPCRNPWCNGMALSTKYYDHELCGQCMSGNDRSEQHRGREALKDRGRLQALLKREQNEIQQLRERLAELEAALQDQQYKNGKKNAQILALIEIIKAKEREVSALRRSLTRAA